MSVGVGHSRWGVALEVKECLKKEGNGESESFQIEAWVEFALMMG